MTPINSQYDTRLVTLLHVTMDTIGELALMYQKDSDLILAERLYKASKKIGSYGEEPVINRLLNAYPLLSETFE